MNNSTNNRSSPVAQRKVMILARVIVVSLLFIISCSGERDGDGGNGHAGAGACRRFAARYTESSSQYGSRTWTCAFDRSALEMTCILDVGGLVQPDVQTTLWDTIAAAVGDNQPFGRPTRQLEEYALGGTNCVLSYDYTYDGADRLNAVAASTSADNCGTSSRVYDAWDPAGRPTHGIEDGIAVIDCVGRDVTISYDETTRTMRETLSGGTNCSDGTYSAAFDEDGIVIGATFSSQVINYAIEARGQICTR